MVEYYSEFIQTTMYVYCMLGYLEFAQTIMYVGLHEGGCFQRRQQRAGYSMNLLELNLSFMHAILTTLAINYLGLTGRPCIRPRGGAKKPPTPLPGLGFSGVTDWDVTDRDVTDRDVTDRDVPQPKGTKPRLRSQGVTGRDVPPPKHQKARLCCSPLPELLNWEPALAVHA